jgi:8-oxo-dGTP pyrophosphatase MutT (NUDIX family)
LRLLAERGYSGIVLLPEPREKGTAISPDRLSRWEDEALRHCDLILMWLPAEALSDFAAIQRWGLLQRSGKLILGTPMHDGPLCQTAERLRIPLAHSLEALMTLGQQLCRPGVYRRGGERSVPLSLWRSPSFQSWLSALVHAGHRLDGIDLEWTHRARGIGRPPFLWAIRPRVQLSGERGLQNGEVVIGRADISATVLYHRSKATPLLATQVVLVREFRAAVRNHGGYAWMLPGGSAARASERHHDARATAAQEIREETGLELASDLLEPVPLGDRQLLASLSSHHGHLFRAALSNAQLATLLQTASAGRPLGATPSERCYVSVRRLEELLAEPDLDWSQLGMVLYALYDLQER